MTGPKRPCRSSEMTIGADLALIRHSLLSAESVVENTLARFSSGRSLVI
jgi:hypothetical protein